MNIKKITIVLAMTLLCALTGCTNRAEQAKKESEIENIVLSVAKSGDEEIKNKLIDHFKINNIEVTDYDKFEKRIDIHFTPFDDMTTYVKLKNIDDISTKIENELIISYTGNDAADSEHMNNFINKLMISNEMIEKLDNVKVNSSLNTLLVVTDYGSYKFKIKIE